MPKVVQNGLSVKRPDKQRCGLDRKIVRIQNIITTLIVSVQNVFFLFSLAKFSLV